MKMKKADYTAQIDKIKTMDAAQQKGAYAMLDGTEIIDDAGNVIETIAVAMPAPAQPAVKEASEAETQAIIDRHVKTALEKMNVGGNRPNITSIKDRAEDDPKQGFKSLGEFGMSVAKHFMGTSHDERLLRVKGSNAPTTYANEASGPDGGFLVPQDFSRELMRWSLNETALLPLTRNVTTTGNSIVIPVDETTPWGTTGVKAFWTAEAAQKTQSKPNLREVTVQLHKLAALVPVTDELLQDSFIGLGAYLGQAAADSIQYETNLAIVAGSGVGKPLGYRSSAALKVVAKTSGQTADTFTVTNAGEMFAAMNPSSIARSVWLHHSGVFPQLVGMAIGQQPMWTAPLTGAPFGTLFGRPLIPSMTAEALGDQGDVDLVDLSQYLTVTKTTGIEQAMSIHLYFDRDITTFRFVFRVGGRPWMSAPLTHRDGTTTYSPFVTLAVRA